MYKASLSPASSSGIIDETRRVIDRTNFVLMQTAAEALASVQQVIATRAIIEKSSKMLGKSGFDRNAMEQAIPAEHLRQARDHVAQGEEHIRRQRALIAQLERDGYETALAKQLLATLEETQVLHEQDRERLIRELAAQN
jgi:hypothetical protein